MSNKRVINMIVDHESRTFRPKNYEEFIYILSFFENKSEVTVTVEPFVRKVEKSQMGLLHAYINEIHKETEQDRESIKTYLKENYGARNEDGSMKSTANYTTVEAARLIDGTVLLMRETLGMYVPDPEEYKRKNIK